MDTEIQHERLADAVTQHEKSAAWYGPGQAIVVPEDFEKAETACQVLRYLTSRHSSGQGAENRWGFSRDSSTGDRSDICGNWPE